MKRLILLFIFLCNSSLLLAQIADNTPVTDLYRRGHYRKDDFTSYSGNRFITSVAIGRSYNYFGTTNGILRYQRFRHEFHAPYTISEGLADNYVKIVAYDFATDYLWALTGSSLSYYNNSFFWWENIDFDDIGITEAADVRSIGIGRDNIWLETKNGYIRVGKFSRMFFKESDYSRLRADGDIIWFGKLGNNKPDQTLYHFDNSLVYYPTGKIQDRFARTYPIIRYKDDTWNHIWFATWGLGPGMIDLLTNRIEVFKHGLGNRTVDAMCKDGDDFWFGGMHGGSGFPSITRWNRKTNTWDYFEARFNSRLVSDEVTVIKADEKYVWFGTLQGVSRFTKDSGEWKTFTSFDNIKGNVIYDLAINGDDVWVGAEYGISRISRSTGIVRTYDDQRVSLRKVYSILCDNDKVWAGTEWGIFTNDYVSAKWDSVIWSPEITFPSTTAMANWKNEIWCATGGGIQMLDTSTGKWTAYPGEHYFSDGDFYRLAVNDKVLFASTMTGLVKLDRVNGRWVVFTRGDGLIDTRTNPLILEGDYIWAGTPSGVTRFYWNSPHRTD